MILLLNPTCTTLTFHMIIFTDFIYYTNKKCTVEDPHVFAPRKHDPLKDVTWRRVHLGNTTRQQ